jgi:hypothetical protein
MRYVFTEVESIIEKKEHIRKFTPAYLGGKSGLTFGKEQKEKITLVAVQAKNGRKYIFDFKDGRQAASLYPDKEIWGLVSDGMYCGLFEHLAPIQRLDYNWEKKEKFVERLENFIKREREMVEGAEKNIREAADIFVAATKN